MTRRLLAVVLGFAMLHLGVARADAACAMHGHEAPVASHEGMQHDAPSEDGSCDTPVSADCCQAIASCAAIVGPAEASRIIDSAIVHMTVSVTATARPLSRFVAPETPPPKA